jgi:hypothetical protein
VPTAKALGAEVTGAWSRAKVDLVHSIAAERIFHHTADDPTADGRQYHRILNLGRRWERQ